MLGFWVNTKNKLDLKAEIRNIFLKFYNGSKLSTFFQVQIIFSCLKTGKKTKKKKPYPVNF